MTNRTRRRESGKMLLDICKYLLTVGMISSFANARINVPFAAIGAVMALLCWVGGFLAIPQDADQEAR